MFPKFPDENRLVNFYWAPIIYGAAMLGSAAISSMGNKGGEQKIIKDDRGKEEYAVYDQYIEGLLGGSVVQRSEYQQQLDQANNKTAVLDRWIAEETDPAKIQEYQAEKNYYAGQAEHYQGLLDQMGEGGYLAKMEEFTQPYLEEIQGLKDQYKALSGTSGQFSLDALENLRGMTSKYEDLYKGQDDLVAAMFGGDNYKPINLGTFNGESLGLMYPHYKKYQEIAENKIGLLDQMSGLQNDILSGVNTATGTQSDLYTQIAKMANEELAAKAGPTEAYLQKLGDLHKLNESLRYGQGGAVSQPSSGGLMDQLGGMININASMGGGSDQKDMNVTYGG